MVGAFYRMIPYFLIAALVVGEIGLLAPHEFNDDLMAALGRVEASSNRTDSVREGCWESTSEPAAVGSTSERTWSAMRQLLSDLKMATARATPIIEQPESQGCFSQAGSSLPFPLVMLSIRLQI